MKKMKKEKTQKETYLRHSLDKMTFKDLKRQAITLGMPFPEACGCGIFGLINYIHHSHNNPDPSLVEKFDQWMSDHWDEVGLSKDDPIRSPRLRLGFIGEEVDEEGKVTKRRASTKIKKPKKPAREKDQFGHVKGTKKQYTWELTQKGYDLERVTRRVQKRFPQAKENSISLWYRAAKRECQKNGVKISIPESSDSL